MLAVQCSEGEGGCRSEVSAKPEGGRGEPERSQEDTRSGCRVCTGLEMEVNISGGRSIQILYLSVSTNNVL